MTTARAACRVGLGHVVLCPDGVRRQVIAAAAPSGWWAQAADERRPVRILVAHGGVRFPKAGA